MSEHASPTPPSLGLPGGIAMPAAASQLLDRIGGPRRAAILAVGVAAVLVILGIARWATAPTWVPIYSNLPIESVGTITERLDEESISYRLESGGTELQVASADLARARVAMAREGMPQAGRPGLEIFDQPAWGMTDFTQRVNYRRALEGELERTIGKMRGVAGVKVHVAMEQSAGFRRSGAPSEASVVLKLHGGTPPAADMVQGIAHLVSSSVDGVEPERVMVLDDTGRLLSSPYAADSPAGLASRELKMRSEVEGYLASKAEEIVTQIVGPGNVRVEVAAELNLDRVQRTVETVDPERQVLSSEQRSEIVPGAEGGAGSSSVTATYMNTRSVETFDGAVGTVKRVTAAVLVNDRVVTDETGAATYEARSPQELAQIEALVSSATGLDETRGDVVNVVSFPFDGGFEVETEPTVLQMVGQYHRPGIGLLALLVTLVVAFRVTRTLQKAERPEQARLAAGKGGALDVTVGTGGIAAELEAAEPELVLPRAPSTRDAVAKQIDAQPEVAVKLIRAWIKES